MMIAKGEKIMRLVRNQKKASGRSDDNGTAARQDFRIEECLYDKREQTKHKLSNAMNTGMARPDGGLVENLAVADFPCKRRATTSKKARRCRCWPQTLRVRDAGTSPASVRPILSLAYSLCCIGVHQGVKLKASSPIVPNELSNRRLFTCSSPKRSTMKAMSGCTAQQTQYAVQ